MQEQCRASEYRNLNDLMQLSVEHIAPQCSLNEEDPRGQAWREELGGIDVATAGRYVYTLGNLTLLPSEINAMVGALPFADKVTTYARQPLLLTRAIGADLREGHATGRREFADRHDLHPYLEWSPETISSRHGWLVDRVAERWPLLPEHP